MNSGVNKRYHNPVGLRLKHKILGIMSPTKLLPPRSPIVEAQTPTSYGHTVAWPTSAVNCRSKPVKHSHDQGQKQ